MAGLKINTYNRIYQAVAFVTYVDGRTARIRISRQRFDNLVYYYQRLSTFKYCKIYEIVNYIRHSGNHQLGAKIGFITKNGFKYDPAGIYESQASTNYTYNRNK